MTSWLTEVLKLLGLTTPFIYAAATYGLFHLLDKKASGAAKHAMTSWLQRREFTANMTGIVVELFDRIYTRRLSSLVAFFRSAIITVFFSVLININTGIWEFVPPTDRDKFINNLTDRYLQLDKFIIVGFNIVADYVSLFFVRSQLERAKSHPFLALVTGALVGISIVAACYALRMFVHSTFFIVIGYTLQEVVTWASRINKLVSDLITLLPAFVVHLWLPLFALATVTTQIVMWLARAAGWMQWFLKQGQHHPFQAVGYVAALIVLALTGAFELLKR